MSSEAEPSLPVNGLVRTTPAITEAMAIVPEAVVKVRDDLGPAVCPTCGSWQIDALNPLRAASGLLLSLLASLLGLVAIFATLAGLIVLADEGPWTLLLGLGTGVAGTGAGFGAHRVARRPARHRTVCRVCGETEGRWTSSSSDATGVLATLFVGPLLLPGLVLLTVAASTVGIYPRGQTLLCTLVGAALVVLALQVLRRPWTAARGTDWASGSTLGRLFLGGQGVGTNPTLRTLRPTQPPAKALLGSAEAAMVDELSSLVARGVLRLESRDDIVWSRLLSYHRLTIVPSALHVRWEPSSTLAHDEPAFAERLVGELRASVRREAGAEGGDYRRNEALETGAVAPLVRLPLFALLQRVGVEETSARAVEGALRATSLPQRLSGPRYARLRGEAETPSLRKLRLRDRARRPALHKLPR